MANVRRRKEWIVKPIDGVVANEGSCVNYHAQDVNTSNASVGEHLGPEPFKVKYSAVLEEGEDDEETSEDRPDIVVRVFREYLKEFMNDIKYHDMVGRCVARVTMIEFQKR